jgi:iron complex transport system permease protein
VQAPIASRASKLAEELHLLSRFAELLVKQGGRFNRCRDLHTDARPLLRPLQYGSTYLIVPATAVAVGVCTVAAVLVAYPGARWLEILPLGANVANALGVGAQRARLLLLAVAAMLTAGATVVIGPMSFVGLMAPHLARLLGFPRARSQMLVAALIGALLMVLSDWLGRNMIFPQQMPAGVIATLLGGPYLMWLLRR